MRTNHVALLLALLCLPWLASCAPDADAWMSPVVLGGGVEAAGDECDYVTGDYDFGYNGDQSSGDTYGCLDGSPVDGTESAGGIVTTNGRTGNGVEVSAVDEYLQFSKSHSWLEVDGTMWLKYGATTGDNGTFEAYVDTNNYFTVRLLSNNTFYIVFRRGGTSLVLNTALSTVPDNTWFKLEFNIDDGGSVCGSGEEMGVRVDYNGDGDFDDANEGWECEAEGDDFSAMTSNPTAFRFGEKDSGSGVNNTIYIDDVLINFR